MSKIARWVRRIGVIGAVVGGLWSAPTPSGSAWAGEVVLDPDAYYEVMFQTSQNETRSVKPVKVVEIVTIDDRRFLVVEPINVPQKTRGYIAFDRISAITPASLGGAPPVLSRDSSSPR